MDRFRQRFSVFRDGFPKPLWLPRIIHNPHITLLGYMVASMLVLAAIVWISYSRLGIVNTGLLLGGWDAPFYVWAAKTVVQYGPISYMQQISYPQLYTQLLALLGYLFGNTTLVQRVLPVVFGSLRIGLLTLFSYRISRNLHVAGLTALFTPVTIGTLWLVGESHRNNLAYVLLFSTFLLASKSGSLTKRRYVTVLLLFLLVIATQFETFALLSLTLVLSALVIKNWKKAAIFFFCSALAVSVLLLSFPDFLSLYYLHPISNVPSFEYSLDYDDLVFWSLGSWVLVPLALLGLGSLYYMTKRQESRELSLSIFVMSILLFGLSFFFLIAGKYFPLPIFKSLIAARIILLIPIPILLAFGVELTVRLVNALSRWIKESSGHLLPVGFSRKEKAMFGIMLSTIVVWGLTSAGTRYLHYSARTPVEFISNTVMQHHVDLAGYSKIEIVRDYLRNNGLSVPVFMFKGEKSLYSSDQYRSYIGIEIGEHLAYYGDLENLVELRPTNSSTNPKITFLSEVYLNDMLGDKRYLVYPQKASVKTISDLLLHPLVFITPEFYDAPMHPFVREFMIQKGIYVVPSIAQIINMSVSMTLETEQGISQIEGRATSSGATVQFGGNSSWYRLSGYPSYLNFTKLEQGGVQSYPEIDPRRFDGTQAIAGNDPAENVTHWSVFSHAEPYVNWVVNETIKKEGNGSLQVTGTTDDWGNVFVMFNPSYNINLSDYQTLSFWGETNLKDVIWVLVLRDAHGYQASYWNILGNQVQESEVGKWKRLVVNLTQPTQKDSEFDFGEVDYVGITPFVGKSDVDITFHIDDLIMDKQLKLDQEIYKARVLPGESLVVYFMVKEED